MKEVIVAFIGAVMGMGLTISLLYLIRTKIKKQRNQNIVEWSLVAFLLGVFCFTVSLKFQAEEVQEEEIEIVEEVMTIEEQLCFVDSVEAYIKFLNLKHPEVILRQFQIESANFTSKIFRENNNLSGMRIPFKRPNLVTGEKNGYACYDSWMDCIVDYGYYQVWSGKGLNREEYIKMLGNSYATDSTYTSKIR